MTPSPRRSGLARRTLPALALTGASGFLLSTLDHPSTVVDAAASTGGVTAVTDAPATSTAPSTSTVTTPTSDISTTVAPVATTATVATTVPPAPTCTSYTGPSVATKWGPVQVEAAVATDGSVCSVDAIVTPDSKSKSVTINDRAVPGAPTPTPGRRSP